MSRMLSGGDVSMVFAAAWALAAVGAVFIGYFAYLVRRRISDARSGAERIRRIGFTRGLSTSLLGVTFLSLAVAAFAFSAVFACYGALTQRTLIAEIACSSSNDDPTRMKLEICELSGGSPGKVLSLDLEGDRFYVGGDVIKWQRWMSFMGFTSSYKLHSAGGVWRDRTRPARGHNLNGGPDRFIESISRREGRLPWSLLIREASGYDVNKPPSRPGADEHFRLYVTVEDFALERADGPPVWRRGGR